MSISIHITGDTPDQLREALASLAAAMGGAHTFAARLDAAEVAPDEKSAKLVVTSEVASDPLPPPAEAPDTAPAAPVVQANVVKELTPAEMRDKGTEMLVMLYNRDPARLPELNQIRAKYGVKKFGDVPDDAAQAFYKDAMLIANGTGEVAA